MLLGCNSLLSLALSVRSLHHVSRLDASRRDVIAKFDNIIQLDTFPQQGTRCGSSIFSLFHSSLNVAQIFDQQIHYKLMLDIFERIGLKILVTFELMRLQ